jgi:hypothetical protein
LVKKKANPEIVVLEDYRSKPPAVFWDSFPKADMPTKVSTRVDVDKMESMVDKVKSKMLPFQLERARKAISYLRKGAPAHQKLPPLPSCFNKNTSSTYLHGEAVVDTVATWVKNGFAAGPFDAPPLPGFRTNCLMAVDQGLKIRPILNVSSPEGESFNDNVDEFLCEKVQMATARNVSYMIKAAGKNCLLYKTDIKDAYKIVPAKIEDLRLQGFALLGKYFVETRMIFGAVTAVCNYDIVGSVPYMLAQIESGIPNSLVCRAVDDVPAISPANSDWGEKFSSTYKQICRELNIQLADDCSEFNKAFTGSTYGKILGKWFDTNTMSWKLDDDKKSATLRAVREAFFARTVTTKELQSLNGRINDIATMYPMLKVFRFELNKALSTKLESGETEGVLPHAAKEELNFWAGFLEDRNPWHKINPPQHAPPLCPVVFTSDAAGCPTNCAKKGKLGVACIGTSGNGSVMFAQRMWWDKYFISTSKDEKGVRYGDKTTTLETMGLLLPFLAIPANLVNKHILLRVDNLGTVYGLQNHSCSGDKAASVLIKAITLLGALLGSAIHVEHLPRRSDWEAEMVDDMSREKTTDEYQRMMLDRFNGLDEPTVLLEWMKNPLPNWDLAREIISVVKAKI